jgi:hypothetical protein
VILFVLAKSEIHVKLSVAWHTQHVTVYMREICGSYGGSYDEQTYYVLGYHAVKFYRSLPTLWRNILPPSSRSKSKWSRGSNNQKHTPKMESVSFSKNRKTAITLHDFTFQNRVLLNITACPTAVRKGRNVSYDLSKPSASQRGPLS